MEHPFVFLSASSESRVVFRAIDPDGNNLARVTVELEQNDPLANSSPGEVGTFFLLGLRDVAGEQPLFDISGSSGYDSAADPEPDFSDPFASGYDGFTTATSQGGGQFAVEFGRMFELELEEGKSIELTTLQSLFISGEPAVSGDIDPWQVDSSDAFVFRISSPEPGVRFEIMGTTDEGGLGDYNWTFAKR